MGNIRKNRDFHEARWDEPIIMELGSPGERGVMIPLASDTIKNDVGSGEDLVPEGLLRKKSPALPEMSQMQVLRHYMRLSQETIGTDINIDIGLGTCTMKYSPKINEQFARSAELRLYLQMLRPYGPTMNRRVKADSAMKSSPRYCRIPGIPGQRRPLAIR